MMRIILAYDIDTAEKSGARRLRRIARLCEQYGTRVQHSVFEMTLDPRQLDELKGKLSAILSPERDSLHIWKLGGHAAERTETMGAAVRYTPEETLIL